jgi:hypothetical protein
MTLCGGQRDAPGNVWRRSIPDATRGRPQQRLVIRPVMHATVAQSVKHDYPREHKQSEGGKGTPNQDE